MTPGDVAAWIGAATGSLALGWQIVGESRTRLRRHAEKVSVVPVTEPALYFDGPIGSPARLANVTNSGLQPIYDVFVVMRAFVEAHEHFTRVSAHVIAPGETRRFQAPDGFSDAVAEVAEHRLLVQVTYRDADGRTWTVSPSGQTTRATRGRGIRRRRRRGDPEAEGLTVWPAEGEEPWC